MVNEELGAEAFPGLPEEGLCRALIPLRVGAEVAGLNDGRHRRWGNTKRLLNPGDERHKTSYNPTRSVFIPRSPKFDPQSGVSSTRCRFGNRRATARSDDRPSRRASV